jgi:peroxiredoxin
VLSEGDRAPDFTLLDQDGEEVTLSGLRGRLRGLGREAVVRQDVHVGVNRSTVIIGPDGRIAHVFGKVSPKTHDDVVLAALDELQATAT